MLCFASTATNGDDDYGDDDKEQTVLYLMVLLNGCILNC